MTTEVSQYLNEELENENAELRAANDVLEKRVRYLEGEILTRLMQVQTKMNDMTSPHNHMWSSPMTDENGMHYYRCTHLQCGVVRF